MIVSRLIIGMKVEAMNSAMRTTCVHMHVQMHTTDLHYKQAEASGGY
jgi:hypothetical protein